MKFCFLFSPRILMDWGWVRGGKRGKEEEMMWKLSFFILSFFSWRSEDAASALRFNPSASGGGGGRPTHYVRTCRRFVVKVCFFPGFALFVGLGGLEKGSENEAVHVRLSCHCGWFFSTGGQGDRFGSRKQGMERKKAIIVLSSATAKVDHCCERSDFYFVLAAMAPSHAIGIHESKKKPG